VTDANPGRDAGTTNRHAGAHADIELPNGHADARSADRYADSTNRYTSTTHGNGGATHADIDSPNGYASAPACHTDAAAAAYGHADLPTDCSCYRDA